MTVRNASTEIGRGRGTLPLHPIPKTNLGHLHRILDTPAQSQGCALIAWIDLPMPPQTHARASAVTSAAGKARSNSAGEA